MGHRITALLSGLALMSAVIVALPAGAATNITPRGALDSVTVARTTIGVRGWALDQNTTASIQVHVYVDGKYTRPITANAYRPDIQRAYGIGNYHGYAASWLYPAGVHKVCTYAINVPAGANPLLGCRTVTVPPMTPYPTPTPTPTVTPTPTPTVTPTPTPTPTVTPPTVAPVTKVLTILVENKSLSQMQAQMPYAFGLAKQYGYATNYFATMHPSLPNYIAIAGGQTYAFTTDNPPATNKPVTGTSVFGQAIAAGKTAALYAEGMPTNCATVDNAAGKYAVKHNAWAYYSNERSNCLKFDVPTTQLDAAITAGTLPNVGQVIPNMCNDAHDCSLAVADAWIKVLMPKVFNGADWKSGHLAVMIMAEEDDSSVGNNNRVGVFVIHPSQTGHVVTSTLTHYSLTRFYEDVAGVPYLFNAATAPSMSTAFGLPLTVPVTAGTAINNAYVTGYGWPDNSPAGTVVSGPGSAGGTGTYADPITLAVGYVGSIPDIPYGTKFYIPNVRRYFVVQDTCASCHATPAGASVWVDMWVGGNGTNNAGVLACEDTLTGNRTIIRDPAADLPVVPGPLYNGGCAAQFGG